MIIRITLTSYLMAIALIHKNALEGDFLPQLGTGFLYNLYLGILSDNENNVIFADVSENGHISGFVFGSIDTGRMMGSALKKRFFQLTYFGVLALIRKPFLIKNFLQTFFYGKKESGVSEKAELVVIAVETDNRSSGLGKKFVSALNDWFKGKGIHRYKLTVNSSNKNANGFYRHLGFVYEYSFQLYSKGWNLYTKEVI